MSGNWRVWSAVGAALALTALAAQAQGVKQVDVPRICPLCRTTFAARTAGSGTQMGMRLDLKPLGDIEAPWPVAACPQCRFVLFEDQLDAPALAKLRRYVDTPVYQAFAAARSSYFLIAKLMLALTASDLEVAHAYLKASWQEETDAARLHEDLELSLRHFEAYLQESAGRGSAPQAQGEQVDPDDFRTASILKGELLRRLGRFDEAVAHLEQLRPIPAFQAKPLSEILAYETTLCRQQDAAPHGVEEASPAGKAGAPGKE
jgi:hypothetical protein